MLQLFDESFASANVRTRRNASLRDAVGVLVPLSMQPVLEIVKRHARSFTYSVRGPRSGGVLPASCYFYGGFCTFAECLSDAAEASSPYFARVYVRYQGLCVGEHTVMQLRVQPEALAEHLVQEYLRRRVAADASKRRAA